jgi:hypothetical protein
VSAGDEWLLRRTRPDLWLQHQRVDEPLTLTLGIAGMLILGSVALSQRAAR